MCDTARRKMVSLCSTCYNSDTPVERYCEFSRAQGGREGRGGNLRARSNVGGWNQPAPTGQEVMTICPHVSI